MNNKGFTLIELLATLAVLGIVISVTVISITINIEKAKEKTEEIFIATIKDALDIYLSSDATKLGFDTNAVCIFNKKIGGDSSSSYSRSVKLYKSSFNDLTFNNVINSTYKPIIKSELVNPANKDTTKYQCSSDGALNIYRDEDYVYYYKIDKSSFECLNTEGNITNLPSECSDV